MSPDTKKRESSVKETGDEAMSLMEGKDDGTDRVEENALDVRTFERFQAGDAEAMTAVVRAYQRRLIGFLCLFTRRRDLAEEIAQEVFLDAYRQREEVYSAANLRPWLFTLAKRKALKEVARRHYAVEISVEEDVLQSVAPPVNPGQERVALTHQLRAILQEAIGELNPLERELVSLRYFGDLPIKEIAVVLKMPMGSVGVKLGRSLKKLRRSLESRGYRIDDLFPST